MTSSITLRMQFALGHDEAIVAAEIDRVCKQAKVDEIMFFAYGEELNNGHESLPEIAAWMASIRPHKQRLEKAGISCSLNPWHTLLHIDRGRRLKPDQPWQTMVDWQGSQATSVVCPLDGAWQNYYAQAMQLFAAERFRVIWIDDDFRYHNHPPLNWGGCFCPLHVAEFNRRAGAHATREEILHACLGAGQPHPWRQIWLDMWQETALKLAERWQAIVAAHGCKLGLMSSDFDAHSAEGRHWSQWARAFAGSGPFVHRPHYWVYSDVMGKDGLANSIAMLDQNRRVEPAGSEVGPEVDNGYYYPWNKSYRQTTAQLNLAQVFGSTNLNVSLYDFMGNLPSDDTSRVSFLQSLRPNLDFLQMHFPPTLQSQGIGIVWREDYSRRMHAANPTTGWRALHGRSRAWVPWLGALGFGFQMADAPAVNALAGEMAWALDDAELHGLLAQGLLLDGPAAMVLAQRGFSEHIGLSQPRTVTQQDVLYSMEQFTDPEFAMRVGSTQNVNAGHDAMVQGRPSARARVISRLLDPRGNDIGHGMLLFENSLGGRVLTVPFAATDAVFMSPQRASAMIPAIQWLAKGAGLGRSGGGAWLIPQFISDGKIHRAVIWNAGFDPVDAVKLELPSSWPVLRSAYHLLPDGKSIELACKDNQFRLSQPLAQWELVVAIA